MRVAFLSDSFASGEGYGLGRPARELYQALQSPSLGIELMPSTLWRRPFEDVTPPDELQRVRWGRRRVVAMWQKVLFPPLEWMLPSFDLVHSLELEYPVATYKPWVATVHNIGALTHPHFFPRANPQLIRDALRIAAKKAATLICVSEATAQSVQEVLKRDLSHKIRVIPQGVAERFSAPPVALEPEHDPFPHEVPFFLVSGSASPRKNLARIIDAFEQAAPVVPHHLVMTGTLHGDYQSLLDKIEKSPYKPRIHRTGYVSEEKLHALYHRASLFLYLSLMEGFGLPLLEAMASGSPILASNVSAMPEITAGAAHLVDPQDTAAIAQGMIKLAEDRTYASELAQKGKARAQQMTWHTCAQRTAAVYREVSR